MNAFYQTAITFVGQNYGAGKCKRVDRIAVQCVSFSVISGLAFGNLAYFFGETLAGFYVPAGEHEVIAQALIRLSFIACPYFICGIMDTLVGVPSGDRLFGGSHGGLPSGGLRACVWCGWR